MPGAKSRGHRLGVQRDDLHARIGKVVGQEPGAVAKAVVGIGDRKIDFLIRTSSVSPGSAPSMAIGPVRIWPPGPRSIAARRTPRAALGSTSAEATPAFSSPAGLLVSRVWTTTMSPDFMREQASRWRRNGPTRPSAALPEDQMSPPSPSPTASASEQRQLHRHRHRTVPGPPRSPSNDRDHSRASEKTPRARFQSGRSG